MCFVLYYFSGQTRQYIYIIYILYESFMNMWWYIYIIRISKRKSHTTRKLVSTLYIYILFFCVSWSVYVVVIGPCPIHKAIIFQMQENFIIVIGRALSRISIHSHCIWSPDTIACSAWKVLVFSSLCFNKWTSKRYLNHNYDWLIWSRKMSSKAKCLQSFTLRWWNSDMKLFDVYWRLKIGQLTEYRLNGMPFKPTV